MNRTLLTWDCNFETMQGTFELLFFAKTISLHSGFDCVKRVCGHPWNDSSNSTSHQNCQMIRFSTPEMIKFRLWVLVLHYVQKYFGSFNHPSPKHFVLVQIILVRFKLDFSGIIFVIWTCPKWFLSVQNNWYSTKMIWTVQNNFGPIKGQDLIFTVFKPSKTTWA